MTAPMSPGLNLCVVSSCPPDTGGQEDFGWHMVRGLERTGRFRAITVLAAAEAPPYAHASERTQEGGGIITVRRAWARDDLRTPWRLLAAIREEQPHVTWFSLGLTMFGRSRASAFLGCSVPMIVQRLGIPTVVTLHEIYRAAEVSGLGLRGGRLTAWGARRATRMLMQAQAVCLPLGRYAALLKRQDAARRARHLPLGVYVPPEALPHPAGAPREEFLMFTAHAPYKGLAVLLEALPRVRRSLPGATLTLAGSDHPRYPGYLAAMRERMNGLAGVRWLGLQTEVELRAAYARARAVVLPYMATTGASSALHYAAAYGRPVVVSDLPDLRAMAEEEDLWVNYAPPGEPAALAEALLKLLSDPARQAAQAAHNLAVARTMTLEHTCARYVELFEEVRGTALKQT